MQSFVKLLRICDIELVLRKTSHFYTLVLLGLEKINPNWLKKTSEMCLSSQYGIHKKTESMNLALLDLQKKLISVLYISTHLINGLFMKIFQRKSQVISGEKE